MAETRRKEREEVWISLGVFSLSLPPQQGSDHGNLNWKKRGKIRRRAGTRVMLTATDAARVVAAPAPTDEIKS